MGAEHIGDAHGAGAIASGDELLSHPLFLQELPGAEPGARRDEVTDAGSPGRKRIGRAVRTRPGMDGEGLRAPPERRNVVSMENQKLLKVLRQQGLVSKPARGASAAVQDEHERGVSWGVFLVAVVVVLGIGVALGFGVSERVQERELLWRWLLDRSERTIDAVANRYGEVWLKQLRLDAVASPYLESQLKAQREHLEHLGTAMLVDEPVRSQEGGPETEIIFVNGTETEIVYYWIDHDGDEHYWGRVAPESGACQDTYEGHAWVVKNDDGETLSVFYAALPGTLILEMPPG